MKPDELLEIIEGDCFAVLPTLPAASIDAIVTDPPYGIGFMGHEWDTFSPDHVAARVERDRRKSTEPPARDKGGTSLSSAAKMRYDESRRGHHAFQAWTERWAVEALRVLKPGGHLVAFGAPRSYHRLAAGIEDAGFEIDDSLLWLFGQGFPKSYNVAKAFDRREGLEGELLGTKDVGPDIRGNNYERASGRMIAEIRAPAGELAQKWKGWGTALKPAYEPIVLAQKPVEENVLTNLIRHDIGALNIDETRIATNGEVLRAPQSDPAKRVGVVGSDLGISDTDIHSFQTAQRESIERTNTLGRWPANVMVDAAAAAQLDAQSGERRGGMYPARRGKSIFSAFPEVETAGGARSMGDTGGASRFFYVPKARADRGAGNTHPTVKPVELMRWLVRLVAPRGALILDPFAGSGTTGQAALLEGMRCVLIEREHAYVEGIREWRGAMQIGMGWE